jgi:hypothetical protein
MGNAETIPASNLELWNHLLQGRPESACDTELNHRNAETDDCGGVWPQVYWDRNH